MAFDLCPAPETPLLASHDYRADFGAVAGVDVWYTTSTADVLTPAPQEKLEMELRLSLVSLRLLLLVRSLEARGEPVRSKCKLRAAYEAATGRSTNMGIIGRGIEELRAAGLLVGLRLSGKSS